MKFLLVFLMHTLKNSKTLRYGKNYHIRSLDKLDKFQYRSGKIEEFGWCDLERISADVGTKFTSTGLQDACQTRCAHLTLSAPEHQ